MGEGMKDPLTELCEEVNESNPIFTFEVQHVGRGQHGEIWTVMAKRNGVLIGGDHHWLNEIVAQRAMKLYERHPFLHGSTESAIRMAYVQTFDEML
jgi:hypothetical protein